MRRETRVSSSHVNICSLSPRVLGIRSLETVSAHTCCVQWCGLLPLACKRRDSSVFGHWRDVLEASVVPMKGLFEGEFD